MSVTHVTICSKAVNNTIVYHWRDLSLTEHVDKCELDAENAMEPPTYVYHTYGNWHHKLIYVHLFTDYCFFTDYCDYCFIDCF